LEADGPLVAAPGDDIDAVLLLAAAAMTHKRRIGPVGREGVGTDILKLLPRFRGNIFGMGVNIHSERMTPRSCVTAVSGDRIDHKPGSRRYE
jgi:hypothetical protein